MLPSYVDFISILWDPGRGLSHGYSWWPRILPANLEDTQTWHVASLHHWMEPPSPRQIGSHFHYLPGYVSYFFPQPLDWISSWQVRRSWPLIHLPYHQQKPSLYWGWVPILITCLVWVHPMILVQMLPSVSPLLSHIFKLLLLQRKTIAWKLAVVLSMEVNEAFPIDKYCGWSPPMDKRERMVGGRLWGRLSGGIPPTIRCSPNFPNWYSIPSSYLTLHHVILPPFHLVMAQLTQWNHHRW